MASQQVGDYLTPDMLMTAYNQAVTATPPDDYLGVILLELTHSRENKFFYINLKLYPRLLKELDNQSFALTMTKDEDARWTEYTIHVDADERRRCFFVVQFWASGKLQNVILLDIPHG